MRPNLDARSVLQLLLVGWLCAITINAIATLLVAAATAT